MTLNFDAKKGMALINFLKNLKFFTVWKDPVWSKVIASAILGLIALLWTFGSTDRKFSDPTTRLSDFSGQWQLQIAMLEGTSGDKVFYQPVRFEISNAGIVSGTAAITTLVKAGKPSVITPPKVVVVSGSLSDPFFKRVPPVIIDGKSMTGDGYRTAHISLQFEDGTLADGAIGFTEGFPVVEWVTLRKGDMIGKIFAQRL